MSDSEILLSIRDVKKTLQKRVVLDVEFLTIQKRECAVLYGENGSGKTTLMTVLAGLVAPDSGVFEINGTSMNWRAAFRTMRKNIVYLHQAPYLFDRTVSANVAYGLVARGLSRTQIKIEVEDALEWAGLSALAERNARDLSGGEKQRVALTRARILRPLLLLLDEPTAAMDRSSRSKTFKLIQGLVKDGISVYIATHESTELYKPDRIIEMQQGRITRA